MHIQSLFYASRAIVWHWYAHIEGLRNGVNMEMYRLLDYRSVSVTYTIYSHAVCSLITLVCTTNADDYSYTLK